MREVVFADWCDPCYADGEQKVAATKAFVIGIIESELIRPSLKVLRACEKHAKEIDDLAQLVHDFGEPLPGSGHHVDHPADRPRKPAKTRDCPVCGYEATSNLPGHIFNVHMRIERPALPEVCPDCGYVPQGTDRLTTSVGKHRQVVHSYDPVAEAYAAYQAMQKAKGRGHQSR